jgi:hypothetical protein
MTTTSTREQGGAAASTAADETKRVGQVAGQEAQNVVGEATAQVRNLADEARVQVEEQSRTQRDRLVSTLSTFSDDLDSMTQQGAGGQGLAADLVRMVSSRARDLSGRLQSREPQEILEDVRSFARRRPGTFLLGSLAAGVVAGRLIRGAKDAGDGTGSATGGVTGLAYDPVQVTAPGDPAFGTQPATATIADAPVPVSPAETSVTTSPTASDTPLADEVASETDPYGSHRGAR